MAQDYSEYLAVQVLNEQQQVSYRDLSRALKVHSNLAKQMLYEFHRKQNSKKQGSIHATYLITGTKEPTTQANGSHSQDDGEDNVMQSSPPMPSSSFQRSDDGEREMISTRTIMIVKEENLAQAKAQFDSITGIHIYSLQANGLSDIHTLTECNRRVVADYAKEDPLKEWKQYGVIQNPNVKRRDRRNGPPPAAAAPAPAKKEQPPAAKVPPTLTKQASTASNSSVKTTSEPAKAAATRTTTAKKDSSNIFKSFAKGAASAKAKKSDSEQSSKAPSPAPVQDVDMTGFSDDDEDDADSGLPDDPEVKEPSGPTKQDRKADLEAMMDMDDEPMEDAAPTPEAEQDGDAGEHDEGAIDKPTAKEESKETLTVENGRRRGRRRVMKKKTVKDEEGYLVTREEAAWESFSEDEPAPKKAKVSAPAAPTNKTAAKKGGKPGQGNIMSFFGKK
ncbi:Putative DNA polymerase delta subunit 3 [Septoria linicola]|uniref:DNA polymerase delta subunit 3 n=1 Tax=Septoria linicola TaxID=215465 RepID=A0A9Q9EMG0_9PEZI|nr:putative DNA polymerase delta subunit 3 [Septoria linicola]USW56776.1 Putative DNA polymerase delta subunit 3 [Septoria linicola]